jgi:hypothetical protein
MTAPTSQGLSTALRSRVDMSNQIVLFPRKRARGPTPVSGGYAKYARARASRHPRQEALSCLSCRLTMGSRRKSGQRRHHRPTGHPLANLALLKDRAQAWRSSAQLASYPGVSAGHVRRAVKSGRIPCRRRPGAGRFGEMRFQARDFPSLRNVLRDSNSRLTRTRL